MSDSYIILIIEDSAQINPFAPKIRAVAFFQLDRKMASNNLSEMESLKKKSAVRSNPFFLSLSKGSASRIPQDNKIQAKENQCPSAQYQINQFILNASDTSVKNSSVRNLLSKSIVF